jgi:hypothetical protein
LGIKVGREFGLSMHREGCRGCEQNRSPPTRRWGNSHLYFRHSSILLPGRGKSAERARFSASARDRCHRILHRDRPYTTETRRHRKLLGGVFSGTPVVRVFWPTIDAQTAKLIITQDHCLESPSRSRSALVTPRPAWKHCPKRVSACAGHAERSYSHLLSSAGLQARSKNLDLERMRAQTIRLFALTDCERVESPYRVLGRSRSTSRKHLATRQSFC